MADYLMPNSSGLTVTEQRYIFGVRNRMLFLPANFPLKQKNMNCACGDVEDMRHVYLCTYWNTEKEEIEYNMIYTYHISQLVKVYKRFEQNYQKREKYTIESIEKMKSEKIALHGIPNRDPIFSLFETSNGI